MTIGDCYKCGDPVQEGTRWDISISLGFTCEKCGKDKAEANKTYKENARWLKDHNNKIRSGDYE